MVIDGRAEQVMPCEHPPSPLSPSPSDELLLEESLEHFSTRTKTDDTGSQALIPAQLAWQSLLGNHVWQILTVVRLCTNAGSILQGFSDHIKIEL